MTTRTYPVLSIDAWADGDDGWTWNNWWRVGTVDLDIDAPHDTILAAMTDAGYLKPDAPADIEDVGEYNLVVVHRDTREPVFAIEYAPVLESAV